MDASEDEIECIYDPPLDYSEVLIREVRESCPRQAAASSRPYSSAHASQVADLTQMQSSLGDLITTPSSSRATAPSWKSSLFFWRRFRKSQAAAAAKHPAPSSKPLVIKPVISGVPAADQCHSPPCKRVKSGPIYNTSDYSNDYSAKHGYGSIAATRSGSATPTASARKPTSEPFIHCTIPYFQLRDAPPRVSTSRLPLYIVS